MKPFKFNGLIYSYSIEDWSKFHFCLLLRITFGYGSPPPPPLYLRVWLICVPCVGGVGCVGQVVGCVSCVGFVWVEWVFIGMVQFLCKDIHLSPKICKSNIKFYNLRFVIDFHMCVGFILFLLQFYHLKLIRTQKREFNWCHRHQNENLTPKMRPELPDLTSRRSRHRYELLLNGAKKMMQEAMLHSKQDCSPD